MFMNPPIGNTNEEPIKVEDKKPFDGKRETLQKYLDEYGVELTIEQIDAMIPESMRSTYSTDLCQRVYDAVTNYFM